MGSGCQVQSSNIEIQQLITSSQQGWVKKMDIHSQKFYKRIVVSQKSKTCSQRYYCLKEDSDNWKQGIIFSNCNLYAGPIIQQVASGNGRQTFRVQVFSNKQKIFGSYKGLFTNNVRHGHGLYEDQLLIFQGNWKKGYPISGTLQIKTNGQPLKYIIKELSFQNFDMRLGLTNIILPDKSQYTGQIRKAENNKFKIDGKGMLTLPSGDIYTGEFKNGKFDGQGVYSKSNSDIKYEGQYKNGMKHGIGKLYFDRGKILSGTWNKGKKEGQFTLYKNKEILGQYFFKNDSKLKILYSNVISF